MTTKKSTSVLATLAVAVGLAGLSATGCGLDTAGTIQPPQDTTSSDPPVEDVVPIDRSEVGLESPER